MNRRRFSNEFKENACQIFSEESDPFVEDKLEDLSQKALEEKWDAKTFEKLEAFTLLFSKLNIVFTIVKAQP